MYEITRFYDEPGKVEAAILRLRDDGFTDESLRVMSPGPQGYLWALSVQYVFGMGRLVTDVLERYDPGTDAVENLSGNSPHHGPGAHAHRTTHLGHRDAGVDRIAALSGHRSPGAISELSGHVRPGEISALSGQRSPGAISRLSSRVSPGAISRLSGRVSPGAIARLSAREKPAELRARSQR